jgi:hypothetical protein
MSIIVVCPGCLKSFQVSDQFAGRTGPCPKCKRTLTVPDKAQQVEVHAPEEFAGGGRSATGKLITKPVAFETTKAQPVKVVAIVAGALTVLALTWVGGHAGLLKNMIVTAVGLLAVSPLLVIAAYAILRNQELEPYRGTALYVRSSLCAFAYVALWGIFSLLVARGVITGELFGWLIVVPAFAATGGMFALATLDLDYGDAVFHFGFYVLVTLVLRWAAGMKWVWDVTS